MSYKLVSEIVPSSSWYNNVRSNVTEKEWNILRKKSYEAANHKCEICGDTGKNQGFNHNVECHEIWEYNDETHVQKLIGLISLCPYCHKVKHPGLAGLRGETDIVINQLMKVNNITEKEAQKLLGDSWEVYFERSLHQWELDITYIDSILKQDEETPWWDKM